MQADETSRITVVWGSAELNERLRTRFLNHEVVQLAQTGAEQLDFYVNGALRGRGEMVHVNGRLGLRVTELLADEPTCEN